MTKLIAHIFFLFFSLIIFKEKSFGITNEAFLTNFPEGPARTHAAGIVTTLTAPPRTIEGVNGLYGFQYPGNINHLHMLFQEGIQDKNVLEIAGADGPVSLLFALAGAHVETNDLSSIEIQKLRKRISLLPGDYAKNIQILEGDIFPMLVLKENEGKKYDFIIARNFIHFLTDTKRNLFLHLVNQVLKPGGIIYITSNGREPIALPILRKNPGITCFKRFSCILNIKGTTHRLRPISIPLALEIETEDRDPVNFKKNRLIKSISVNPIDGSIKKELDPSAPIDITAEPYNSILSFNFQHFFKEAGQKGFADLIKATVRLYQPDQLAGLFTNHHINERGYVSALTGLEAQLTDSNIHRETLMSYIIVRKDIN